MKKLTPVYEDVVAAGDDLVTTIVEFTFENNDNAVFEPIKGGMQVAIKGTPLPHYEGNFFSEDFLDYLREHKVGDFAVDQMYNAVEESLRKSLAIQQLLKCMK